MASSAGQLLVAGRIPGEEIGATENTSDSSSISSEAVVMTLTVPLVSGRTYWIWANPGFNATASGNHVRAQLREDSISGTVMDSDTKQIEAVSSPSTRKTVFVLASKYTASASANKTFVVTAEVVSGASGTVVLEGASTRKSYLRCLYNNG